MSNNHRGSACIALAGLGLIALGSAAAAAAATSDPASAAGTGSAAERCQALGQQMQGHWPDASTRIVSAQGVAAGPLALDRQGPGPVVTVSIPEHCEVVAQLQARTGEGGQPYAIGFHLRLPSSWNGRFFFQGGGGSNGQLGDAVGVYSTAVQPALAQGFAVVSQDSGHDNRVNQDPQRGGMLVFGFDAQARANYGHASLPLVADAAKAAIAMYYGRRPQHSYFVGCSKGGEEALALAERYASEFDGIVAGSPGLSLPRAAVEEAWDTQALASVVRPADASSPSPAALPQALSAASLAIVREAVLKVCDADDGVRDGIVGDFSRCTSRRVEPELRRHQCAQTPAGNCLSANQISALLRIMGGAHDQSGHALYSDWPWDTGLANPGWGLWKMGDAGSHMPALNVILGGPSLAMVFTTPPTALPSEPQALLNFLLNFSFERDAPTIYATSAAFPHSAWDDVSARSADLTALRARGAKVIVTHGVSDPVFSINDTLAWWREVDARNRGHASNFVRVFAVPGMTHCGGGEATDQFDVLPPLMQWVEQGVAPERIEARASPASPWPARSRPLCAYPKLARYNGSGDVESASSFSCRE